MDASIKAFLAERAGYVKAALASREADADYYRWQGHMEARRMLCKQLTDAGLIPECQCGHHQGRN